MLKKILCLLFILSFHLSFAQQDSTSSENTIAYSDKIIVPNVAVKIAPLRALEFYNTLQIGVEYRLGYQMSLQHEIGYGNQAINVWNYGYTHEGRINGQNFRLGTEFRIYLESMKLEGAYAAFEVGYRNSSFDIEDSLTLTYPTHKQVYTYRFKLGKQVILAGNWIVDGYIGLGLKQTIIRTDEQSYLNEANGTGLLDLDKTQTGSYFAPSLALSLKIGYRFNKK